MAKGEGCGQPIECLSEVEREAVDAAHKRDVGLVGEIVAGDDYVRWPNNRDETFPRERRRVFE